MTVDIKDTRLDGRIDINVISKSLGTSESMEIEALKARFLKRGLVVGNLISSIEPIALHEGVRQSKIDAYEIGSENARLIGYETWIAMPRDQWSLLHDVADYAGPRRRFLSVGAEYRDLQIRDEFSGSD